MEVKNYKIKDLNPAEYNPRKISREAMSQLKKSLEKFESVEPAVVNINPDRLNVIVGGHQRIKAAKALKWKEFPCVEVNLPIEEEKELNVRLNKNTGEFDFELLETNFDVNDLEEWGFDPDELNFSIDEEVEEVEGEDDIPEVAEDPVSRMGDLWKLGNHVLMCGDSTVQEQVDILMAGNKAAMIFTDPPYKIETKGGRKGSIGKGLAKQGADIDFISNFDPSKFLSILSCEFKKKKFSAYVFCNKDLLPDYLNWAKDVGVSFNLLIWKKPNAIPIGGSHRPDIEYILLFRKSGKWNGNLKNVNYSRCIEAGREKGDHPTIKPISLITNQLLITSDKNDLILDLFGGSGSTLIACEKIKRKCFMMEIDPKYCDLIIKRWEGFTGEEAVHENGKTFTELSQERTAGDDSCD